MLGKDASGSSRMEQASVDGRAPFRSAHLLSPPRPVYPLTARRLGWEGLVTIRLTVDSRGAVTAAEIVHTSGHRALDDAALAAVVHARFDAATLAGRPVASTVLLPVRFRLSRSQ